MRLEKEIERLCATELAKGRSAGYVQRFPTYARELEDFLRGRGKRDLRAATEDDVVDYLDWLEKEKGLSRSTVTNRFFQLRRIFAFLERGAVLLQNPVAELNRKRYPRRMRDWLSEEEARRLLELPPTTTVTGLRDRAILEVLYATGLRMGELRALELDDVDLGEGLVTVKASKNGSFRRVPLGKVAGRWLGRYLQEVRPRLVARRELGVTPSVALFLNQRGGRMAKSAVESVVTLWAKRSGIAKRITPHVIRHSFAIHMLKNGASSRHIQAMLGHRCLSSTQIYTRVLPQDLKRVHRRCHPAERSAKAAAALPSARRRR